MLSAKEDHIVEEHTSLENVEVEIKLAEEYRGYFIPRNTSSPGILHPLIIGMKTRGHWVIRAQETVSNDDPWLARLSDVSANSAGSQHSNLTVRLRKLMIEKINRDVSLWQEFWSQYETVIHSNDTICKREKFTYLKEGRAHCKRPHVKAFESHFCKEIIWYQCIKAVIGGLGLGTVKFKSEAESHGEWYQRPAEVCYAQYCSSCCQRIWLLNTVTREEIRMSGRC